VIDSFADRDTEAVYHGRTPRRFKAIAEVAERKLVQLATVTRLEDLRVPPGNRLEKLQGDRRGRYSIRINDQWRVCFTWTGHSAADVEIVDYH
jgi:toxin HigB-1